MELCFSSKRYKYAVWNVNPMLERLSGIEQNEIVSDIID